MENNKNTAENDAQELEKNEKKRRVRALTIAALIAFAAVGGFILVVEYSDVFFEPKLDIESGEKDVVEVTNDPQCRALIADVTSVGVDFKAELPKYEAILTVEPEKLPEVSKQIGGLKQRLNDSKAGITNANLRFDESRTELQKWFKHVELELRFLEILIDERTPKENAEGTVVHDANKKKSKKTPEERLDGALLATTEAFESFRVWHTGGLHPCGAADEGETPWTPTAAAKKTP